MQERLTGKRGLGRFELASVILSALCVVFGIAFSLWAVPVYAQAFEDFVMSSEGQSILQKYAFLPAPAE